MKHKVGDKIKIKSIEWYMNNANDNGDIQCGEICFTKRMMCICGKTLTVKGIGTLGYNGEVEYYITHDYPFMITDEMLDSEQFVYMDGNKSSLKQIKNTLTKYATCTDIDMFDLQDTLVYVDPNGIVRTCNSSSDTGKLVKQFYTEIEYEENLILLVNNRLVTTQMFSCEDAAKRYMENNNIHGIVKLISID